MAKTSKEIIEEIFREPAMKALSKGMSEEDRKMIDEPLQAFVEGFVLPLVNSFEAVIDDPEASAELKRQLGRQQKDVVKPES